MQDPGDLEQSRKPGLGDILGVLGNDPFGLAQQSGEFGLGHAFGFQHFVDAVHGSSLSAENSLFKLNSTRGHLLKCCHFGSS